jgi:hypothetical protein
VTPARPKIAGVVAELDSPEALVDALGALRARGYRRLDAYVPYPVHGLDEALALPRSRLDGVAWVAGAFGAAFAFWLQWLVNHRLYDLDIGGRPSFAIPTFIIVTFETFVLFGGVTAFLSFAWVCRLPRLAHPLFDVDGFASASIDRFWLGVSADDPAFDAERLLATLRELGARRVELARSAP